MGKLTGEGGGEETSAGLEGVSGWARFAQRAASFALCSVGSGILAVFLGPMLWEAMGSGGRAAAWPLIFVALPLLVLGIAAAILGMVSDFLGLVAFMAQVGGSPRAYWLATGGGGPSGVRVWSPVIVGLGLGAIFLILSACSC